MDQIAEHAELQFDPYGRFMKIADVMASVGISRPQIYKLMRREDLPFPSPIKVESQSLWVEQEIIQWKQARIYASRSSKLRHS